MSGREVAEEGGGQEVEMGKVVVVESNIDYRTGCIEEISKKKQKKQKKELSRRVSTRRSRVRRRRRVSRRSRRRS